MKKILMATFCMLVLAGCTEITEPVPTPTPATTPPAPSSEATWKMYQNQQLGISFLYPESLGTPWENLYKETDLVALKFLDTENSPADMELSSADYETLRSCDDILAKGFNDGDRMPQSCETLTVDNQPVVIVTFVTGGRSNGSITASKSAQFQTKKGVWQLRTGSENLYDELIDMAKSLKYLD